MCRSQHSTWFIQFLSWWLTACEKHIFFCCLNIPIVWILQSWWFNVFFFGRLALRWLRETLWTWNYAVALWNLCCGFLRLGFWFQKASEKKILESILEPRSHTVEVFHFDGLESTVSRILKGEVFKGRGNWGTLRIPRNHHRFSLRWRMCSCLSLKCLSLRRRVFDGSTPSMKAEIDAWNCVFFWKVQYPRFWGLNELFEMLIKFNLYNLKPQKQHITMQFRFEEVVMSMKGKLISMTMLWEIHGFTDICMKFYDFAYYTPEI